jgi:UDP-2-acetamido-2-deoxy-ribo-hexuluronate aminotransferase
MQFIDLHKQQEKIRDKIETNIQQVLAHGKYIMGPEVSTLEERLAGYVGADFAIGCASGTDALLMALMAYGIGPGDAVFTTPFTFISTAEVISLLGATPVFVDIDPRTFNIDPAKLEKAILALEQNASDAYPLPAYENRAFQKQLSPRAVIPVDLFGFPADYDDIREISDGHNLFVIQDAAQSFGATYKESRSCAQGDIGCTSFFPAKPLGGYGDGGMCFTNDTELAERMRSIRVHGKGGHKYDNVRIGINGRLDTLQAAILLAKFEIFPEEVNLRQKKAEVYGNLLPSNGTGLTLPTVPEDCTSVWAQYSVLARDNTHRTQLQDRLKTENIPTAVYYPRPLHLQTAYAYLGYGKGDFPMSEDCADRIFSLPMHPYLTQQEQERICAAILNCIPNPHIP